MVGVFLPTNYKDFPYLRPSKADVVLCEICRMELRHTRIVWLEWGKGESRPSLPGGYSPEDTAGCFPYCTDDAAAVFASGAPPPREQFMVALGCCERRSKSAAVSSHWEGMNPTGGILMARTGEDRPSHTCFAWNLSGTGPARRTRGGIVDYWLIDLGCMAGLQTDVGSPNLVPGEDLSDHKLPLPTTCNFILAIVGSEKKEYSSSIWLIRYL